MKRSIAYIIGLSYLLPVMTVMQYEAKTSLYRRLQTDRPAVEAKMRSNHTVRKGAQEPSFNKAAYDVNVSHIVNDYSDSFLCQSKMDVTKCRSAFAY